MVSLLGWDEISARFKAFSQESLHGSAPKALIIKLLNMPLK